jgi:glycosyltransferase involved in cell wall biosynthesis
VLQRQAYALGLTSDALELRGQAADMAAVYQEADIFVLSSDWEGTPNVVLEAMACGLPVVATRVGGVSEVIQHGITGFHFEPSDELGMAHAICELVCAPHRREAVGRKARKCIEEQRSLGRLNSSLRGLYTAALVP